MKELIKQYKINFSFYGFVAFVLQELPYLPWLLWPPKNNPLANNIAATPLLGILEQVGGVLTIAMLILIVRKDNIRPNFKKGYFRLALICLIIYYGCWICYFAGITNGWIIVLGLSAPVPLYYLFIALGLKNPFAIIPSVVFLLGHTVSNAMNFII